MLMHRAPPKREVELAEHVRMWQDKVRRLEAHGEELKLAPVFKITLEDVDDREVERVLRFVGGGKRPHSPEQVVRGVVDQGQRLLKKEKVV
jgi:hypothetical protein